MLVGTSHTERIASHDLWVQIDSNSAQELWLLLREQKKPRWLKDMESKSG